MGVWSRSVMGLRPKPTRPMLEKIEERGVKPGLHVNTGVQRKKRKKKLIAKWALAPSPRNKGV